MAKKIDLIREQFRGVEGFHFRQDIRGNLSDVTLPKSYELISKTVISGLLMKIEFRDNEGNYLVFSN